MIAQTVQWSGPVKGEDSVSLSQVSSTAKAIRSKGKGLFDKKSGANLDSVKLSLSFQHHKIEMALCEEIHYSFFKNPSFFK